MVPADRESAFGRPGIVARNGPRASGCAAHTKISEEDFGFRLLYVRGILVFAARGPLRHEIETRSPDEAERQLVDVSVAVLTHCGGSAW